VKNKRYEVVGRKKVCGHVNGEQFTGGFTEVQEAILVGMGLIKVVEHARKRGHVEGHDAPPQETEVHVGPPEVDGNAVTPAEDQPQNPPTEV
jgi:hypothetical protein